MPWWGVLLIGIGALLAGGLAGFFIAVRYFKKYQEENTPISEKYRNPSQLFKPTLSFISQQVVNSVRHD